MNINIGDIQSTGNVSVGNKEIINNYYKSSEWQDLQREKEKIVERLSKARINVEKYPQDNDFKDDEIRCKEELEEQNRKIEQFKYEVMQLAEKFTHIKIDTERRKKVYQAFLDGRYSDARAILEAEESIQENEDLLERRESLKKQQEENEKQLRYKAEENILLAHLYMIDYSLGNERVPKVEKYFQLAIDQYNNPSYRLDYALFLSISNKSIEAEEIYKETLNFLRKNLVNYDVRLLIRCLKDFATFLQSYPNRWSNSEKYYREAISLSEKLLDSSKEDDNNMLILSKEFADLLDYCGRYKESEDFYRKAVARIKEDSDPVLVATVYHDFAIMLAKNPSRFEEAEKFHVKSLLIRRGLVDKDKEFNKHLVLTLKSLAKLLSSNPKRYAEAKDYYKEALDIISNFLKVDPARYSVLAAEIYYHFAMLMNNIWESSRLHEDTLQQAKSYYEKAISIYRELNPEIINRMLALVLNNYSTLLLSIGRKYEADKFLNEALSILNKIYMDMSIENSDDVADDMAMVQINLANLYSSNMLLSENFKSSYLYGQALKARIGLVCKYPDIYLKNLLYSIDCVEKFMQHRACDENLLIKYKEACALVSHIDRDNQGKLNIREV